MGNKILQLGHTSQKVRLGPRVVVLLGGGCFYGHREPGGSGRAGAAGETLHGGGRRG